MHPSTPPPDADLDDPGDRADDGPGCEATGSADLPGRDAAGSADLPGRDAAGSADLPSTMETAQLETERLETERLETERLETEQLETERLETEQLEGQLLTLAGHLAAATCRFLVLLAEFDRREGWAGVGVRSCAHWLSWRAGLSLGAAREQVRVARALVGLPATTAAFATGRLSYTKARAITRVATPDTEADLVEAALHAPAAHVERLVQGLRRAASLAEVQVRHSRRELRWWWDEDGSFVLRARLDPEEGATVLAALDTIRDAASAETGQEDAASEEATPDDATPDETSTSDTEGAATPEDDQPAPEPGGDQRGENTSLPGEPTDGDVPAGTSEPTGGDVPAGTSPEPRPAPWRPPLPSADAPASGLPEALVRMAAGVLAAGRDGLGPARRPEIVVHVDAAALTAQDPPNAVDSHCHLDAGTRPGPGLHPETVRRLACDGRIRLSVTGPDGTTLDLGRATRRPNSAQLAALWRRDRGCAVPGCGRTRWVDAHHVRHWAHGGPTSLANLVLLCDEHHRAHHEGGLRITRTEAGVRFLDAAGARLDAAPAMSGDASALGAHHDAAVDELTTTPRWWGEPLHLADAVHTALTIWEADDAQAS